MKRVICTGLAVLDHVFYLPEIPKIPTKSFASSYQIAGGGNAATAAVAISRAGGQAIFWGSLGDDLNGDKILSELEEFGVDVKDVKRLNGINSSVSSVLIDNTGERLITNFTDHKLIKKADWLPLASWKSPTRFSLTCVGRKGRLKLSVEPVNLEYPPFLTPIWRQQV